MDWLNLLAEVAAILTAAVAVLAWLHFTLERRRKRRRLEIYLKAERDRGADQGQRTLLHLMARLGMTEAELLQASFRSRVIIRRIAPDPETNHARALLLQYDKPQRGENPGSE